MPRTFRDLVYKFKKIIDIYVSAQLIKLNSHYKKIGYNINVVQQKACLVANQIMVKTLLSTFLIACWQFEPQIL